MVEYSSPNTNKPLHLGHIRNILLGYSVAQILKRRDMMSSKLKLLTIEEFIFVSLCWRGKKFGNGETPADSGLKEIS